MHSYAKIENNYLKKCRLHKVYTVKKGSRFSPSPDGMSITKLPLAGNNLIIPGQG
jgi:hypothetical protein